VVQGEENERIRLARDLHDGIGGMLSATKMRFMALRHDNEGLVSSPKYLEAMGLLDIMGDEIRKTSHNLMPEVLLKQDLAEALRTYCNTIQTGIDLHIDFQSFGTFETLPNDFKLNIYRIVQELLKNTVQHAKATYAIVQLMRLEAYITVSIEDNGIGFNTDETKDGIGLHNLKTRVLSLEGHYTLKSEPGKGTMVYIEFGFPEVGGTRSELSAKRQDV
jgi:signal transduction histidine kinase